MPATTHEINVIINALVRKLQDVRELNKEIHELKSSDKQPVIIDEKISANAKAGAGDVRQLQTSIEKLSSAIDKLDDAKIGKLRSGFQGLVTIVTAIAHLPGAFEGLRVLKGIAQDSPAIAGKLTQAGTAVRGFLASAREKGAGALATVKENVSGLAKGLPALTTGAVGTAGGLAAIGVTAGVAAAALGAILAIVLAIVAVPAVVGILYALAKGAAEAGSEIHDASQEFAVSAETISALKVATATTTTTFEEASAGVGKFNKLIGEAADGSKEATAKLKQLGLEPQEALKDNEAALAKVFKRIHELPTPLEKSLAATKAFGKGGAALVPVIDSVKGSLEGAKKKAAEFGELLSGKAAKDADEFGDQIDELGILARGFANSIGRVLIPEILKLLRILAHEGPKAGGAFATILRVIGGAAQFAARHLIFLLALVKTFADHPVKSILAGTVAGPLVAKGLFTALENNVAYLNQIGNTPAPDIDAKGPPLDFGSPAGSKTKKDTTPADTSDSEFDFRRQSAQVGFNLEKDLIERLTEIRRVALETHKINTEDFFAQTQELREREIRAELKLQQELAKIESDRWEAERKRINADKETTPAQKRALLTIAENKSFSASGPIWERIQQLKRDLTELPGQTEAATNAAIESLDLQISEFLTRVDEANGRTAAAAADAIDREFKSLLERVTVEQGEDSPLVKLIREFIQLQKDRARVSQIDQGLVPLGQQFEIDRLEVETKVSRHVITQREGRKQINALQRQYLQAQLQILKNELAATNEARLQLEIKLKIAGVEASLAALQEVDETARSINESLRFAFEDFFASVADGTKNIKEAFADLGRSIVQMFAQLAAKKLVESIFGSLFGGESGQGGIGAWLSGLFGGKKAAGDVVTARPGGQFINVAEAGFDEFVVTTDPRHRSRTASLLGNFINRTGIVPDLRKASSSLAAALVPTPRLAAGGLVAAAAGAGPSAGPGDAQPSQTSLNFKHVHLWNPRHIHDELRSSAGEQTILDIIDRNATVIRRRLKV